MPRLQRRNIYIEKRPRSSEPFLSNQVLLPLFICFVFGAVVGSSATSFCLASISFFGGMRRWSPFLISLVFLGSFYFGCNQVTWDGLLSCFSFILFRLIYERATMDEYHLNVRNVFPMTFACCVGIVACIFNISNPVLYVVVVSYLVGREARYDKHIVLYVYWTLLWAVIFLYGPSKTTSRSAEKGINQFVTVSDQRERSY